MDRGIGKRGTSFFAFIHLFNQNLHGSSGNDVNLLADCAGGNDGFSGNGRVVKADNAVVIRQSAVFLHQKI